MEWDGGSVPCERGSRFEAIHFIYSMSISCTWDKIKRKNILFQGEDPVACLFTAWLQCTEL